MPSSALGFRKLPGYRDLIGLEAKEEDVSIGLEAMIVRPAWVAREGFLGRLGLSRTQGAGLVREE